jgi:diacylglycerol kinase (ATP)
MPIKRLKNHAESYRYATSGIFHTLRSQSNIWIQLPIGALVLLMGWYLEVEPWEWVALVITIAMVLVAELLNTSVEAMMNVVQKEYSLDVKVAKDVAAGAVLISAVASVAVGVLIFGTRIF